MGDTNRSLTAHVLKISPTIDAASDSYDVLAQLGGAGASDLRPGMAVRVSWPSKADRESATASGKNRNAATSMRFGPTSLQVSSVAAKGLRRPKLRPDVRISEQTVNGETSYVIKNHETNSYNRYGATEYELLQLCDGTRTPLRNFRRTDAQPSGFAAGRSRGARVSR